MLDGMDGGTKQLLGVKGTTELQGSQFHQKPIHMKPRKSENSGNEVAGASQRASQGRLAMWQRGIRMHDKSDGHQRCLEGTATDTSGYDGCRCFHGL